MVCTSYLLNLMDLLYFQTPVWYNALTLTERIASLQTQERPNTEVNTELAKQRLQRWQTQPPFEVSSFFTQYLAVNGISENEFLYLLCEPVEALKERLLSPPAWLLMLAKAFSHPSSTPIPLPKTIGTEKIVRFLSVIKPMLHEGRDRLHQGIQILLQTYTTVPFNPDTIEEIMFASLPEQLLVMLSRTMVLELNVARLQGVLEGNTTEERFESFLQRLRQHEFALAILQEYPVLARQVVIRIDNWVKFSLEFLQHLCADWQSIQTTFSHSNNTDYLVQVDGSVGDKHRGGRAVLIAKFNSGFQIVYKPKSLAADVHFQELLTWINQRGNHPPFRTLKMLNRDTYGWVEFVVAQSCTSEEQIQRFYIRQGGYLALLYVLEATDFHYENIIAAGEHPILLDLEALFHPRFSGIDLTSSHQLAINKIRYSVLGTGLPPHRIWANAESEGIDLSGLGGVANQLSPFGVPDWEKTGTDEMCFTRKRMAMEGSKNRPTLNQTEVDVLDYADTIAQGFTNIYKLLLKHRDELLADDSPLTRFNEDEVRVIIRSTQTYGTLLYEMFHPHVLRNALERDRLLDRLWISVKYRPYLIKVISAERQDLLNCDIPMFTTRPESRHLWSSCGEKIENFFDEPGISLAKRRLQQLGDDDLIQQLWFIRASLATVSRDVDPGRWPSYSLKEPQTMPNQSQLVAAAAKVGERLKTLALYGEQDTSWIGLKPTNEGYWSLVPLGVDLYDGLAGIALFLAYLSDITKQEHYMELAQSTLTTLRYQVEKSKSNINLIGGFKGWGGIIYTLVHLGILWDEPPLIAEAEEIVKSLPSLIEQDKILDIIAGAAGCIASLLTLYNCAPSERTLAVAIQCGDHLISEAQQMEHGVGWIPKFGGTKPLAGFSHGAAGIAWALLKLAALTGEERYRQTAMAAITYERSLFQVKKGNWLDLRDFTNSVLGIENQIPNFMTAWCHGAPGIGMARLSCLQYIDDAKIRSEIDVALNTTLVHGFGGNHSLCHGDLGNLELLLQASKIIDDPQWRHHTNRLAAIIVENINQHGWLCGIPLGVESPGLMTGLAGIGYELLRLAQPTCVPCVLTLEAPNIKVM